MGGQGRSVLGVGLALARGIAPLNALQKRIRGRESHDLSPLDERDVPEVENVGRAGSALATLDLTPEEHAGYYLGYANSVLWPVFHNRIDLAQFEAGEE